MLQKCFSKFKKKTAKLFLIKCLMTIITDIFISEQIYTTVELHFV